MSNIGGWEWLCMMAEWLSFQWDHKNSSRSPGSPCPWLCQSSNSAVVLTSDPPGSSCPFSVWESCSPLTGGLLIPQFSVCPAHFTCTSCSSSPVPQSTMGIPQAFSHQKPAPHRLPQPFLPIPVYQPLWKIRIPLDESKSLSHPHF